MGRRFAQTVIGIIITASVTIFFWNLKPKTTTHLIETMIDQTLEYFISKGKIEDKDAASIEWYHAANSKSQILEAIQGPAHMIEADILLRAHFPNEPIMAHPPETDSDITLREWLKEVMLTDKGIKLDFKRQQAVAPSMVLLGEVQDKLQGPIWINADILPGPGGTATPLDARPFLDAVSRGSPCNVLSLGWTTGWVPGTDNPGYDWEMVRNMEEVCRTLKQPVTFPVRAALLPQSFPQLHWLLQQSDRYSLTIWTGQSDELDVEDLLPYRRNIDKRRVYVDLPKSQRSRLSRLPEDSRKKARTSESTSGN